MWARPMLQTPSIHDGSSNDALQTSPGNFRSVYGDLVVADARLEELVLGYIVGVHIPVGFRTVALAGTQQGRKAEICERGCQGVQY